MWGVSKKELLRKIEYLESLRDMDKEAHYRLVEEFNAVKRYFGLQTYCAPSRMEIVKTTPDVK